MLSLVLAALLFLTANAEAAGINRIRQKRMVGGVSTTIELHPWQVAIELDGEYYCSGSIVSPHLVLTAAHCVNFDLKTIKVRAGTSMKLMNGSVHHPLEAIPHPTFEINEYLNSKNDIALLRVNESFVYDDTRKPAVLNRHVVSSDQVVGRFAAFTSWSANVTKLQVLYLPIISKASCNGIYEKFGGISDGQICAGYMGFRNHDSCIADSGAPLIFGNELTGVLAYSEGECGLLDYPTVFTEVAYFYDWIMDYVKSDNKTTVKPPTHNATVTTTTVHRTTGKSTTVKTTTSEHTKCKICGLHTYRFV